MTMHLIRSAVPSYHFCLFCTQADGVRLTKDVRAYFTAVKGRTALSCLLVSVVHALLVYNNICWLRRFVLVSTFLWNLYPQCQVRGWMKKGSELGIVFQIVSLVNRSNPNLMAMEKNKHLWKNAVERVISGHKPSDDPWRRHWAVFANTAVIWSWL